ncbi:MAG: quinone-dependent dihydroorotate dehydrogenase [bacterium]|nr:quinone-dependent dihydroorotate dehydrogenase [bacterium]
MKKGLLAVLALASVGLIDSIYLTYEHYSRIILPCSTSIFFSDCGKVLQSSYSTVFGIPLALFGIFYYCFLLISSLFILATNNRKGIYTLIILTTIGFVTSLYLVFLQIFIIKAICLYCMVSALISTSLFIIVQIVFSRERKMLALLKMALIYRYVIKKILFKIDPETVHNHTVALGEMMGKNNVVKNLLSKVCTEKNESLEQTIKGIIFTNPVGLAAGFDYEGRLTQILPSVGFGFQSIGTITNMPYKGNPSPMLGRLPKSQSLMVNKGFKNLGAATMVSSLSNLDFKIPVGISIGRTNTVALKTQKQSIEDIIQAFTAFEKSKVAHSYYELNISCPNLYGDITFYPPKNVSELLTEIDKLHLKKPVFIKMPIEKSDRETLGMLKVIADHSPAGVIFGNLQKDRKNPFLDQKEVRQFRVGYFSGKPTFTRSNELIKLAYRHYKKRFTIIGCGGIFSGKDAYTKITLGASLVQLITGMIFQGPQLIAQINIGLIDLLKKDGFTHISQAIGIRNKS